MRNLIRKFIRNERAATALEYGLLAALIAGGIIVGARTLGNSITNMFSTMSTTMNTAAGNVQK
ncbi:MAG: Flp family type IVb pilin [Azospirillaceae bacterium]|nr:Flp family type IVb pilin [Azospirillaceae bacterium]